MKKCSKCKQAKPLDQFHHYKWKKDNLHYYCNDCRRAQGRKHYHQNKELEKEISEAYQDINVQGISYTEFRRNYLEKM